MAAWNRLATALALVLPAGAFGASVVLALASSSAASTTVSTDASAASQPPSGQGVSIRLQEIRTGVSDMMGSGDDGLGGDAKAAPAWWGNGGWGRWRAGWGNGGWGWRNGGWPNWHNGWGNGAGWGNGVGWGNGGWGNAGAWHNGGWHNFWHNW
jgi:rSAM-associated Gly-rich repeat protein